MVEDLPGGPEDDYSGVDVFGESRDGHGRVLTLAIDGVGFDASGGQRCYQRLRESLAAFFDVASDQRILLDGPRGAAAFLQRMPAVAAQLFEE